MKAKRKTSIGKPSDADKALRLVQRYAILRRRDYELRSLTGKCFDACERPIYHEDVVDGSGCIADISHAKDSGWFRYGPDGVSNWSSVLERIGVCRTCSVGLKLSRHRKRTIAKRRGAVLGAMKRLGSKA